MGTNRTESMVDMTNDSGYILIGTLFFLVLIMIIGMAATTDTTLELQVAGNDKIQKKTFYQADGGTHIAIRLVEENIGVRGAFTALDTLSTPPGAILDDPAIPNNTILIIDDTLWDNESSRTELDIFDEMEVGGGRDLAFYPDGYDPDLPNPDSIPHTNAIVDSATSTVAGAGLQQLAGYEGKGKGTAGGGGQILYTIYSQHIGKVQSESLIAVRWRHVIGLELEGRY